MLPLAQHARDLAVGLARVSQLSDTASARVSSGRRIDRPAADPAGEGRAARLDASQARLRAVEINLQNGVSRLQSTTGHLNQLDKIVTRLAELATFAGNPIQNASDHAQYRAEFRSLQEQLRQTIGGSTAEIGGTTDIDPPLATFNDEPLFGSTPPARLAIGANPGETLEMPALNFRTGPLGNLIHQDPTGAFTLTLQDGNTPSLISTLNAALSQLADGRARVGAAESRLQLAASVATTASANHEAALSNIRDADLAAETTTLARLKILTEGHTAMLAQSRDATAKLIPLLSRR